MALTEGQAESFKRIKMMWEMIRLEGGMDETTRISALMNLAEMQKEFSEKIGGDTADLQLYFLGNVVGLVAAAFMTAAAKSLSPDQTHNFIVVMLGVLVDGTILEVERLAEADAA